MAAVTMRRGAAIARGAVGGLYGAASMSVLRLAMHRAGVIDKMVPQAVEEWLADRLGIEPADGKVSHVVGDQLLHLAYGTLVGALSGPMVASRTGRASLWRGAGVGLATWAFGMLVLFPSLRIGRAAWMASIRENATNIAAHLVYGVSVQLLVEEPPRQPGRARSSDRERLTSRIG